MKNILMVFALTTMLVEASVAEPRPVSCDVSLPLEVHFAFESTEISPSQVDQLEAYIAKIRNADFCPLGAVNVVGHADAIESSPQDAILLSKKRATVISRFLERGGIPHDFLHTEFKGSTQPIVREPSPLNARVEIAVYGGCPSSHCEMFPISKDGFRRPIKGNGTNE